LLLVASLPSFHQTPLITVKFQKIHGKPDASGNIQFIPVFSTPKAGLD
jgi:hypothetical protein